MGEEKAEAEKEKVLGNEAYKRREFAEALEHYGRAIGLDPDTVVFLVNRAAVYFEMKEYQKAIEDCRKAIEENSERSLHTDYKIIARAHARIGNSLLKMNDFDGAIQAFDKSLLEFHDDKVHTSLQQAKKEKRDKEEREYVDPEKGKEARERGNDHFRNGRYPEAIQEYTEAIRRSPLDPAPYSNRAAAYTKLGEFPLGLKDCEKCLELDPKYLKAYSRKGAIHFFMKEFHKCLDVYQKGLEVDPSSAEMLDGLRRTKLAIQEQQSSSNVDENQVRHNMSDPEIQGILSDPSIIQILKELQENPGAGMKAMSNPTVAAKIQKLIAAGVLRTESS